MHYLPPLPRWGCLIAAAAILASPSFCDETAVAVTARVEPAYSRATASDGRRIPETFAFGNGGVQAGEAADSSIDRLNVHRVAAAIAPVLRARGYVSSVDPRRTQLLIMVYWGATRTPGDPQSSASMQRLQMASAQRADANLGANMVQFDLGSRGWAQPETYGGSASPTQSMRTGAQANADAALTSAMAMEAAENRSREQLDSQNAGILGYDGWWSQTANVAGTPFDFRRRELLDELEEPRYYVVLMAYDFQKMWKQKRAKLLWETRYSIRSRGRGFDVCLAAMTQKAGDYFGSDSHGLQHRPLPPGRVEVGTLREVNLLSSER